MAREFHNGVNIHTSQIKKCGTCTTGGMGSNKFVFFNFGSYYHYTLLFLMIDFVSNTGKPADYLYIFVDFLAIGFRESVVVFFQNTI